MTSAQASRQAQGGGYPPGGYGGGPPPGGYGGGPPPGGYGGAPPPGGYGGGPPPGGYGGGPPPGGYGPPGQGGYGPSYPQPGGPPYGLPGGSRDPEFKKRAQVWLIVAAASSLLCTCLFGVIGAYFCYIAMQAAEQGNRQDAENKLRWGKIITVVGLVVGFIMTIVSVIYAAKLTQYLTS